MKKHKDLNIDEETTGKTHKGKPVIGVTFQNGLNYRDPVTGQLASCETDLIAEGGKDHKYKVDKARCKQTFGDTRGGANKHNIRVEDNDGNWIEQKLNQAGFDVESVTGNKVVFGSGTVTLEAYSIYNGIRESVILSAYPGINYLDFKVARSSGLVAEIIASGVLVYKLSGVVKFRLSAPLMKDSTDDYGNVAYSIEDVRAGWDIIRVTADDAFLLAASYPVEID